MSGSNFTEEVGKYPPPSAVPGEKSPVLLGLIDIYLEGGKMLKLRTRMIEMPSLLMFIYFLKYYYRNN